MKTVNKAILKRINAINELLPIIQKLDETPVTYAGGTWPYYVELTAPIKVKNQFIYIQEAEQGYKYNFDNRYNVNNDGSLEQLKYDLTIIKRAFNKALKNQ